MTSEERRSPLPQQDAGDDDILEDDHQAAAGNVADSPASRWAGSPLPSDLQAGEDELRPEHEAEERPGEGDPGRAI